MMELAEILTIAGFFAWFLISWMLGQVVLSKKYEGWIEAEIIELNNEISILSKKLTKEKGMWLLIDYFIGEDGPVEVYECNVCAFEGTDNSDYCPECGSAMYETKETPEGTRRRLMAESEEVVD